MKRKFISVILIVVMILSIAAIPAYASSQGPIFVTTEYFFIASNHTCTTTVESDGKDSYKLSMVLDSIDSVTVTAYLTDRKFTFDNMNNPTALILLHNLWDAIAQNLYEVYSRVYGEQMPGRTVDGISRELRLHEWMMRNAIVVDTFFYDIKDILNRSTVTDLGCIDIGELSDTNAFAFEESQTDVQAMLLYMSEVMHSRVAKVANFCYRMVDIRVWKLVDSFLRKV